MIGKVFISHSSLGDDRSRELRQALLTELRARNRAVFLDEDDLDPDDLWRPAIYRSLAECEGAVLLLSRAALASPWVLIESTILAWRRELQARQERPMTVLVVLLGDVTAQDVKHSALRELALDDRQFQVEPFGPDEKVPDVAARIAARFPELPAIESDAMQKWTENVAAWLGGYAPLWLNRAADKLKVPRAADWTREDERMILAAALLHADFWWVHDALLELAGSQNQNNAPLLQNVLPASSPIAIASAVYTALQRPPSEKVISVRAGLAGTAERLVRRATCCDWQVLVTELVSGDSVEGLHDTVLDAVRRKLNLPAGRPVNLARLPSNYQVVVLLRYSADGTGTIESVLAPAFTQLRTELGNVLFVVLSEAPDAATLLGLTQVLEIVPKLDEVQEEEIDYAVELLKGRFFPDRSVSA